MQVLHRRDDGSFVIDRNGMPFHVPVGHPLHVEAAAAASNLTLPPEPAPFSIAPPSFRAVHVAWFKAALAESGKLDDVDAAVAGLPQAKRVLWEYATTIREDDADVIAVAGALGIDLAALFDLAEAIRGSRA